ncbi:MAG: phosphodiester glycosidase family protein [Ruminococcaceae bacterium]|nr:phosphodiester glycosidase family protein [Oscillospiraceae bacterium]
MKKSHKLTIKILSGIFAFLLLIVYLLYGHITFIKRTIITSAMTTLSHQWIAEILYSDDTIQKVMSENRIEFSDLKTDPSLIEIKQSDKDYELIDISSKIFKGHLLKIYNPKTVELVCAENLGERGEKLYELLQKNNAVSGINASGFKDSSGHTKGGVPNGLIMVDGEIIFSEFDEYENIIGLNKDGKLILGSFKVSELKENDIEDAIAFGPNLIVNGEKTKIFGDGGWGIAPRTSIAQTKDGAILFLVIDGRQLSSIGATLKDVQEVLYEHGAYNAVNLDGGSSSILIHNNKTINNPCTTITGRFLPTAFVVKEN